MATPIVMPKLGMTMREGTVVDWPFEAGDEVEKGEVVLVIESEKAEVEIEATASGVLRHFYVESGETVPCGTLLAALTDSLDEDFDVEAFRALHDKPEVVSADTLGGNTAGAAAGPGASPVAAGDTKPRRGEAPVTPAARALARKLGIETGRISGSGPGGRVTKDDVERAAQSLRDLMPVAGGKSLEVPSAGDGDPLLLIPGFGTDVAAFAMQIPALQENFRVMGMNPKGVGLSDPADGDTYSVPEAAADAATIAAAAAAPVHLLGTSWGAAVALETALTHPELVKSLTLMTPCFEVTSRLSALIDAWCAMAAECSAQTLALALLPWFFSQRFFDGQGNRQRSVRGLAEISARVPAATLRQVANGLRAWSGSRLEDLSALSMPCLLVIAGEDLLTPDGESYGSSIKGSRTLVVAGAGHAVGLEAPEQVNSATMDFLASMQ